MGPVEEPLEGKQLLGRVVEQLEKPETSNMIEGLSPIE